MRTKLRRLVIAIRELLSVTRDTVVTCGIPITFGAGLTYVYDNRLTVGADVMFQNWSKVTYMNDERCVLRPWTKIAVGAEYLPNPMGRSYLSHVKYRLGAYYSKPYYKIDGMRAADEYGVTAGFGLAHSAYAFRVEPFGTIRANQRQASSIPERKYIAHLYRSNLSTNVGSSSVKLINEM